MRGPPLLAEGTDLEGICQSIPLVADIDAATLDAKMGKTAMDALRGALSAVASLRQFGAQHVPRVVRPPASPPRSGHTTPRAGEASGGQSTKPKMEVESREWEEQGIDEGSSAALEASIKRHLGNGVSQEIIQQLQADLDNFKRQRRG